MRKRLGITGAVLLILLAFTAAGAGAEKTVLLTFAGDCTLGSEEKTRDSDRSFDTVAKAEGYDYFLAGFRDLFEKDDLTVVNLEGVLSDTSYQERKKNTFRFRGPTEFVKILTGSFVELATIANNHIGDYGSQGEESTRKTLEANGIAWAGNNSPWIFEHDGIRIAFYAFDNSRYQSMKKKLGSVFREMREKNGVNAIVVCVHAGLEYRPKHNIHASGMANTLVESGADLVIMHHPHVLQGMERINRRTVFYSIGNFVFGGNSRIKSRSYDNGQSTTSLYTMAVQVRMVFSGEGQYLGQRVTIYPAYTSTDPVENRYQPFRVDAEKAVPVREAIQRDTAFELPEITERDGLSVMEFDYLAATDETLMPEE